MCDQHYILNIVRIVRLLLIRRKWVSQETHATNEEQLVEECQSIKRRESSRWQEPPPTPNLDPSKLDLSEEEEPTTSTEHLNLMPATLVGDLNRSPREPDFWMWSTTPLTMSWSELRPSSRTLLYTLMPLPSDSTITKTMISSSVKRRLPRLTLLLPLMLQVLPLHQLPLNPRKEADTYKPLSRESKLAELSTSTSLNSSMPVEC